MSSEASVTGNRAECAEAKRKIWTSQRRSNNQSMKTHPMPDVPHKTRQELQKLREYEQEATEIIVIAEGTVSGNGRVTNGSCGRTGWGTSNKDLWSWRG